MRHVGSRWLPGCGTLLDYCPRRESMLSLRSGSARHTNNSHGKSRIHILSWHCARPVGLSCPFSDGLKSINMHIRASFSIQAPICLHLALDNHLRGLRQRCNCVPGRLGKHAARHASKLQSHGGGRVQAHKGSWQWHTLLLTYDMIILSEKPAAPPFSYMQWHGSGLPLLHGKSCQG